MIDKYWGQSTLSVVARKLRLEYPGAMYHVMNRGDRREPVFRDDADRKQFVETLGQPQMTLGRRLASAMLGPVQARGD